MVPQLFWKLHCFMAFRYHKLRNSKAWHKKPTKEISHFFVYSRRATHDPHYTWHGDRGVPPIFAPPNFFDPINSFAARGYWKFVGKCPHRGKMLITWVFVPRKRPNEKLKSYLLTRTNAENFVKILQTSRPWGTNFWPKFEILTVFGGCIPTYLPR